MQTNSLSPALVFEHFKKINDIPRPSKHEEKMVAYLTEFGRSRGLETLVDNVGNVLIHKPATQGYKNRERIILQSHMDMVCDKLIDKEINFLTDPIESYIDGDWLRARGTTLGADDGIGCAIQLAILDATDIDHCPIDCLFTVDEETGLTGAANLSSEWLRAKKLINLDSEDEGQFFVSCAGGQTTTATFTFHREEIPGAAFLQLTIKGLNGGHSGDDINKKRANAIKLMARFLSAESSKMPLHLCSWQSGKMHNAIPRDGVAIIAVSPQVIETVRADWNTFAATIADEYHVTEQNMEFILNTTDPAPAMPLDISTKIILSLQALTNGVYAMCQDPDIEWLVETSSNVASIVTTDDNLVVIASQRSNIPSALTNICDTIRATFLLAGATVSQSDGYPAWTMKTNSQLRETAVTTYTQLFNKKPLVLGIHAGLECGLFSQLKPDLDMLSIGPTLRNVHTPDEALYIPSVDMVWQHLLAILQA